MRTKIIGCGALVLAGVGACVSGEFEQLEPCPAGQARGEGEQCRPAGGAGGAGGGGGQGGSAGPAGGGGMAPSDAPVLQVPPRRVGLRRARALDVPVGLEQPVGVDLRVTVEGLPAYMAAEPLTIPAGASSGVLIMRATEGAPLGVPSQVRVRAAGAAQPAEAVLEAWVQGEPGTLDETFGEGGGTVGPEVVNVVGVRPLLDGSALVIGNSSKRAALTHYLADGKVDAFFGDPYGPGGGSVRLYAPSGSGAGVISDDLEARAATSQPDGKIIIVGIRTQLAKSGAGGTPEVIGHQWHVSRHLPDGELDVSFAQGGAISVSDGVAAPPAPAPQLSPLASVAVAPDGSIVVGAQDADAKASPFRLFRLTPDGAIDGSFGSGGFVRPPALTCKPASVVAFADGSVAVGGHQFDAQGEGRACVARFLADGTPDPAFGTAGHSVLPLPQAVGVEFERIHSVAVDDARVIATGYTRGFNASDSLFTAALLLDGSYDSTFGSGGRSKALPAVVGSGLSSRGMAMIRGRDGGLFTLVQEFAEGGGDSVIPLEVHAFLHDARGAVATSFGTGGGTKPFGGSQIYDPRLVESVDGRILIVAHVDGTQRVARLWP